MLFPFYVDCRKAKDFSSSQEDLLERLVLIDLHFYYEERIVINRIYKLKVTILVTFREKTADEYLENYFVEYVFQHFLHSHKS